MAIERERAVTKLRKMIEANERAIETVKRKRWRDSEKAMTAGDFVEDNEALQLAIEVLQGRGSNGVA